MIKSIIKECFIILLLIIAIILILGIILYDYNPGTQIIPAEVEDYVLPQEMQEELNATIETAEKQNIVKTYRVDSSDLKKYESTNDYEKGKVNPFDAIPEKISGGENNPSDIGNSNSLENKTQSGTTSQGTFLNTVK